LVDFKYNGCINKELGCETCKVTQEDLNSELEDCYANCTEGTICHNSYLDPEILQYLIENVDEDQVKEDQEPDDENYQNMKKGAWFLIFLFIFLIASCFLLC
jgi:hypothetical protein